MSTKILRDSLRASYMEKVRDSLAAMGEEVLQVGSNEFAIPCVDGEGNDEFVVINIKVPLGSRDGDAYDGYSMAEDYEMKCREREEKAKAAAEKKAAKIARDEERRRKAKEAKAAREAAKNEEENEPENEDSPEGANN